MAPGEKKASDPGDGPTVSPAKDGYPFRSIPFIILLIFLIRRPLPQLDGENSPFSTFSPFTNGEKGAILIRGNQRNPFNSAREAGKARSDPT